MTTQPEDWLSDILDEFATAIESGDMVLDIKEMETMPPILKKIEQEVLAGWIDELESFRTNTGQYEMERNYDTPSGRKNWNTDVKARNKLKTELDKKLTDRLKALRKEEKNE